MSHTISELRSIADGLDHPEGVAPGLDGFLYAGGEAGQIYRIDPRDRTHEQIADTGGWPLGIALDGHGAIYACDCGRNAVMRIDPASGAAEPWCESADGEPLDNPNWAAFAPDGSLWFSHSGSMDKPDGLLMRVPPGGGEAEVQDVGPLLVPNGLAIAPDGVLYLLESYSHRVSALRDGRLETICHLPSIVPDGVAVDADGGLVIACYYPYVLLRIAPGASSAETLLDDPVAKRLAMPTNVCFFGEGLRELAIASLGGQEITAFEPAVPGAPLHYPV